MNLLIKERNPAIYVLPYGQSSISFQLPESCFCDHITYREGDDNAEAAAASGLRAVREALAHPIGTPRLTELAKGRSRAVIIISDGTRLCPSDLLLPELILELNQGGIPDESIDIVIALGLHRKHTTKEMRLLVGESVFQRVRVHNHSPEPEDCVRLGMTSSGTPVEVNRRVAEADLRIVTGNIEPHALVGVSGGIKALIPGTASKQCIEHNHSLSIHHSIELGSPDNRIHADMEEALRFIPVHFMLNVIANHQKQVLAAVAGHIIESHRLGVQRAAEQFMVPVARLYDLTIVSPGGHPKDMQMYQSLKALRNASSITKSGGTIIMAASCQEQFGNGVFQYWVETMKDLKQTAAKLNRQFVIGAHKISHLDEVLSKQQVYLLSDMPEPLVQLLGFEPVNDLQLAIQRAISQAHGPQSIAYMPFGSLTFPVLVHKEEI